MIEESEDSSATRPQLSQCILSALVTVSLKDQCFHVFILESDPPASTGS